VNLIRPLHFVGVFCLVALAAEAGRAQLININFTSVAYTGTTETSPATPSGPAGTWNNLTTGAENAADSYETDSAAVFLADGSPGPTLTFDASSGTSSMNAWNGTSFVSPISTTDYTTAGGVYDVPNLYETGLVNGGNNITGFRLKGLAAGTYEVFLVPMFRTPQAAGVKADPAISFRVGLGNTTDARDGGDYTLTSTATTTTQHVDTRFTSWVAATDGSTAYNYIGATVTIDSPDRWLTMILMGDSIPTGPDRTGPSVIQIRAGGSQPPDGGDFDNDGDVDGNDFLKWQRGESPTSLSEADLDAWKANFGPSSLPTAAVAPEPATGALVVLLAGLVGLAVRGKSSVAAATRN
jgi:hypothetical protein